ncbi:Redoxin [Schizopora paradoxa]|uniref:Redoxin n=1 Tax=Schizopora paradoxa TaxID=27342 RepID=A0A0H2SIF4_9AGAM|nr:Redoxin [Schizopora paradoxa]
MAGIMTQAAKAAHATAASLLSASPIKVGDKLPLGKVKEKGPTADDAFDLGKVGGKIVIVGIPAAYSPTCSNQVPGYIKDVEKFKEKGVSDIYVVSVNDYFVMSAWKKHLDAADLANVHFVADDTSEFSSHSGLLFDATGLLGAPRAKRFTAVVQDGVVEKLYIEENPGVSTVTAADNVLKEL